MGFDEDHYDPPSVLKVFRICINISQMRKHSQNVHVIASCPTFEFLHNSIYIQSPGIWQGLVQGMNVYAIT